MQSVELLLCQSFAKCGIDFLLANHSATSYEADDFQFIGVGNCCTAKVRLLDDIAVKLDGNKCSAIAELREQLAGERVAVETSRQQLNAAREAGARWQGRAEVAQQELAELKLQATQNHEEAAKWQGRTDALQEALMVARQQVDALSERVKAQKEGGLAASRETRSV